MKTKKMILNSLALVAVIAMVMVGCKKKTKVEEDTDTQAAQDNEQAENMSNDAANLADAAAAGIGSFRLSSDQAADAILSPCATVTWDSTTVSGVTNIVIDFGATNCTCSDGRNRRGKVLIAQTGYRWQSGSSRVVTFDGFYINDKHFEGTHSVTFNGQNSAGHYNWTINAQSMKITRPDGRWHTWNSVRNREMIEGDTTLARTDDVFLITGTASGSNINGVSYTATITTALRRALNCRWFESGVVEIVPQNRPARTLDYGNTGCDANATVTINGNVHNIQLN